MSREIKYRVWDNENKSYSDPYSSAYYALTQDGGLDFYCHGDHMMEADPNVYFIEQYTGLKDKNGKEIYEGDVVDVWIGGCKQDTPYVVEDMRELYSEFHHDDGYYQFSEVEIIGNIHKNPELLREEEE